MFFGKHVHVFTESHDRKQERIWKYTISLHQSRSFSFLPRLDTGSRLLLNFLFQIMYAHQSDGKAHLHS